MLQNHIYACIMAGGVGERFWPGSRRHLPKQFLNIIGSSTMIQATVERVSSLIPKEKVWIVSNEKQGFLISEQLPSLKKEQVLLEPFGRNTAPCIALAAACLKKQDPDAIMVVLPSDHVIRNTKVFLQVIHDCARIASQTQNLVTLGIKPYAPETGYGYIHYDQPFLEKIDTKFFKVKAFVEKPTKEKAEAFLKDGHFLWNSGMFIWSVKSILEAIKNYLPQIDEELKKLEPHLGRSTQDQAIRSMYEKITSVSIDYGVMEKAKNILVAVGDFGWDDVGSWSSLENHFDKDKKGNTFVGHQVDLGSQNIMVINHGEGMVATLGLQDVIIVRTSDAVLVMDKTKGQEVKAVLELMKKNSEHQKYL